MFAVDELYNHPSLVRWSWGNEQYANRSKSIEGNEQFGCRLEREYEDYFRS